MPLEIGIRLEQNCAVPGEVGFLDRGIERDELGARRHIVAALEVILLDDARDLRRHVDALDGHQRADRLHPVDPLLGAGALGGDRGCGRRHLSHELFDHRRLEHEVEIADTPEKQGDENAGNEKAFDHCCLLFWCRVFRRTHPPTQTLAIGEGKIAPAKSGREEGDSSLFELCLRA